MTNDKRNVSSKSTFIVNEGHCVVILLYWNNMFIFMYMPISKNEGLLVS